MTTTPPRTYPRRGPRADAAALAASRLGSDAAREARPAFRSVGQAVTWYFATSRKHSSAKTNLGVALEQAQQQVQLGVQIAGGGQGSVVERELCLLADVGACLPTPIGGLTGEPDGRMRSWRAWTVFLACLRDGHDIGGAAGKVRELLDVECDWREARALLKDACWAMREAMKAKGLV